MKAKLIRVGNSQGIRIPKPIIEECRLGKTVEITVENNRLIVTPVRGIREGWEEAFREMGEKGDDELLIQYEIEHSFDEEEWE